MKSLFNPADNKEIIDRINRLSTTSQAEWGKMNVSQMVEHLQMPLKSALGDVKLKRSLPGMLFGSLVRKRVVGAAPFKRNLPTDKNFIVKGQPNFDKEKKELIALVQRFAQVGPDGMTRDAHPFFGKMTPQEWDILQWKHLDHHLQQFGV